MKKIAIIVMSEYKNDPRVYKHAVTAEKNGYDVEVVSFTHPMQEHFELVDGIPVHYYSVYPHFLKQVVRRIYTSWFFVPVTGDASKVTGTIDPSTTLNKIKDLLHYGLVYVSMNIVLFVKLRKLKADLYLVNDLPVLLTGVLLSRHHQAPLIYDSHELWADSCETYSTVFQRLMTWHERYLIGYADRVVTVNHHIADILVERYGINPPLVVFNCPMYSVPSLENIRFHNRAIYQGRYSMNRGIEETIESSRYLSCDLYLRGLDDYNEMYTTKLRKIVRKNVFFLPSVDMKDLVYELAGYDIGIIPYRPTNLDYVYSAPNKLFEYMMAGLAVAASDLPVIKEVLQSSGCGLVFNPDDPESIARTINLIMQDPARLTRMKEASCRAAKARWNWEVQSASLVEEYKRLLS